MFLEQIARPARRSTSSTPSPRLAVTKTSNSFARTGHLLLLDAEFWSIYLPNENSSLDGSIGGITSAPWIRTVRDLAQTNSNVQDALQACVFAGIGWVQEDPDFLRQGTQSYARALRGVNDALQDPKLALQDGVLACCRLLSLFELFQRSQTTNSVIQSQRQDWRTHVEGTCRIVALRGPEYHESLNSIHLYDGVRMTVVIFGVVTRRPNAFNTLPWHVPQRTLRDSLWDLGNNVPMMLKKVDESILEMATLQGMKCSMCLIEAGKQCGDA